MLLLTRMLTLPRADVGVAPANVVKSWQLGRAMLPCCAVGVRAGGGWSCGPVCVWPRPSNGYLPALLLRPSPPHPPAAAKLHLSPHGAPQLAG